VKPDWKRTTQDVSKDWRVEHYACLVSLPSTEKHDTLGQVMLSIYNLMHRGYPIFRVLMGKQPVAEVRVKPDGSEIRIEILQNVKPQYMEGDGGDQ